MCAVMNGANANAHIIIADITLIVMDGSPGGVLLAQAKRQLSRPTVDEGCMRHMAPNQAADRGIALRQAGKGAR